MTNHPTPTGRREVRDGRDYLVFERVFRAPITDVWAAVTDPDRLERWIGTWAGDPASGGVAFRMTAEGPDVPEESIIIDECVEPTRLVMRSDVPESDGRLWIWQLHLAEADGVTTLTFAQEIVGTSFDVSIGPGWDYYLDRLVAAESAADVEAIDFDDYYPAFAEHYSAELS